MNDIPRAMESEQSGAEWREGRLGDRRKVRRRLRCHHRRRRAGGP